MNHHLSVFSKADPDAERRRALSKVYDLLIKLAEEKEKENAATTKDKEKPVPLKSNIPVGQ